MQDNDIIKAFNSLYIKLLDVKYDLKITKKEFLALNEVHNLITRQQDEIERLKETVDSFTDIGKLYSEIKSEAVKDVLDKVRTARNQSLINKTSAYKIEKILEKMVCEKNEV